MAFEIAETLYDCEGIKVSDKARSELRDFALGADDHTQIGTDYEITDDEIEATFSMMARNRIKSDYDFDKFVKDNAKVVKDVFETLELTEEIETEVDSFGDSYGSFSLRVKEEHKQRS